MAIIGLFLLFLLFLLQVKPELVNVVPYECS
jgi:hypothetical protein